MTHSTFPGKGKPCQNPSCLERTAKEQEKLKKFRETGEKLLQKFLNQPNAQDYLRFSKHAQKRAYERSYSEKRLFLALESTGYVIGCPSKNVFVVMGREKVAKAHYRAYHIVIEFYEQNDFITANIRTAYDPMVSAHLYDESLEVRHCWCQPHYADADL